MTLAFPTASSPHYRHRCGESKRRHNNQPRVCVCPFPFPFLWDRVKQGKRSNDARLCLGPIARLWPDSRVPHALFHAPLAAPHAPTGAPPGPPDPLGIRTTESAPPPPRSCVLVKRGPGPGGENFSGPAEPAEDGMGMGRDGEG